MRIYCPSQQHDSRILIQADDPKDGHSHARTDSSPKAGGTGWQGSISDYRAVAGSTCVVQGNDIDGNFKRIRYKDADSNPLTCLQRRPGASAPDQADSNGSANRGVQSWTALTSLKSITDGTSKTLLGGEVSRRESERTHAFNGDYFPGYWVGEEEPFCQKCTLSKDEGGDAGFGGAHNGVVNFAMCDGSVQTISKDINLPVLDRMATRAGDDPYEMNGVASPCNHTP